MINVTGETLFIDPGIMGTGFAYFKNIQKHIGSEVEAPFIYGVLKSKEKDWHDKAHEISSQFEAFLRRRRTQGNVVIEFPELYASAKSHASAAQGDLFKLTYLIGLLSYPKKPILVTPREWKGQLPKERVITIIKHLAPEVKISNHSADAIGMGFSAQGYFGE